MPKGETVDDGASERRRPPMDLDGFLSGLAIEAAFAGLVDTVKRGNPRRPTKYQPDEPEASIRTGYARLLGTAKRGNPRGSGATLAALSSYCRLPHEDPGAANG